MTHDDERGPAERDALDGLPRAIDPGDLLEERTVQALAARGLLRAERHAARPRPRRWLIAAAACAVFFVAGFSLGRGGAVSRVASVPPPGAREAAAPEAAPGGGARPSELERPSTPSSDTRRDPGMQYAAADSMPADAARYVVWF